MAETETRHWRVCKWMKYVNNKGSQCLGDLMCNILPEGEKNIYGDYVVSVHSSRLKIGTLPFKPHIKLWIPISLSFT